MALIHVGNWDTLKAVDTSSGVSDGDTAHIYYNARSRMFTYVAAGTEADEATEHPYYIKPTTGSGHWVEQIGNTYDVINGDMIRTGAIESTNWSTTEGSRIDLDAGTIQLGGSLSPKFSVTAAGVLTATGANITGAITAATIDIGGSDDSSFHIDVDGNMWLGAAAFNIATNPFAVSNAGAMRAVSGIIGGLTLSTTALYTGSKTAYNDANAGIHFGTDGIGIGNNIFTVSAAGALVSTSGTIAGLTINATDGLYAGTGATRVQMKPGAAGVGGIWTGATAVADAKNYLNVDGAGKLASGNITWDSSGNLTMTGTWSGSSAVTLAAGADITLLGSDVANSLIRFIDPPTSATLSSEIRFERYEAPTEYWYIKKVPEGHGTQPDFLIIAPTDELIAAAGSNTKMIMGKHPFESNSAYSFSVLVSELFEVQVNSSANILASDGKITLYGNVGIGTLDPSAYADLTLEGGALCIKERTTPTADTDYGKVYTKSDNKLYFQDGAGTEHEIAFV